MINTRSELENVPAENLFLWATGIEDTFITDIFQKTGRSMDEYELTNHYTFWRQDLDLVKQLEVPFVRYGIPWHRINPAPGKWEWDWTDQVLERLLELKIQPIVDLVHYGVPAWIENSYLNPDFPERMTEYASEVAARYRGKIHFYTPFNEPRIAAWYCGRIGWWPPFQRSWKGFVTVLMQIARGVVKTHKALLQTDPENVPVHVDATDLYFTTDAALQAEVKKRQEIVFLALDLIYGQMDEHRRLWPWLRSLGISATEIEWFQENRVVPDVLGINLYPMFTYKQLRASGSSIRFAMRYAGGQLIEQLCTLYWKRYKTRIMITETASLGSVRRRAKWMDDSVAAVRKIRESGLPVIGYTWWPLFSLVAWAFRQGIRPLEKYLLHMGLWDLVAENGMLLRQETPLVQRYREIAQAGTQFVSPLRMGVNAHV